MRDYVKEIKEELKKYDVDNIKFNIQENDLHYSVDFINESTDDKSVTSFRINKGLNSFTIEELVLKAVEEIQKKQK